MGTYTVDGNTIDISSLSSTRKGCLSDDANKYEAQIIETLEKVNTFDIERTSLQLKSEDEKYRINYSVK
jgi:heat shock protein HslJ